VTFGVFEAAVSSEAEAGLARTAAQDKMAAAVYDVREKLGPFLFAATSVEDFRDRVAMTKNDQSLFRVIEGAGLHPATGTVRRIAGKNSILENEFKAKLASPGLAPAPTVNPAIGPYEDPGSRFTTEHLDNNYGPETDLGRALPNQALTGRRHRAEITEDGGGFDGEVDTDATFKPSEGELKPEGDFEKYKNKVDQDAPSKVQRNFASKMAWNMYLSWCECNGKSPARLSSLDAYGANLSDAQYLRLANTITAWANEHKPTVPDTKLKKKDKVAGQHDPAVGRPNVSDYYGKPDWVPMRPTRHDQGGVRKYPAEYPEPELGEMDKLRDNAKISVLRRYVSYCDAKGISKVSKRNVDRYADWQGLSPVLRRHLYAQMATTIRWAKKTACWPGCHENEAHAKKFHNKESRRRTAGPDYLQKADDALTQLLNQKAEEFQETIAPLQQALQTVQQAEQLQAQQNPLNVLPPAGTVNVLPGGGGGGGGLPGAGPGGGPSTAQQVGMPDPNSPDMSGLAQMLAQGAGAGTGVNDAPTGGGQDAPPPAAAGAGALPDDLTQKAARRKRRRVTRPRQAAGVGEQWDRWRNQKAQQGDVLRGGDVDYDQFANERGVGQRALQKLKQRNETPDFAPINQPEHQLSPRNRAAVGNRRRAYYDDDDYEPGGTSDDFHDYNSGHAHEQQDRSQQNGWKLTHADDEGHASWSHPSGHSVTGRDGPNGGSWQLHGPKGPMGHPQRDPVDAQRLMPKQARRTTRGKARGAARPRRAEQLTGPFAGYQDFEDCESKNSDKGRPDAYCGEIHHQVEKGRKRKGEPLHDFQDKQSMRKGAPFAGYDDFSDCESQNSDKDDSGAYCGEIKHKTEDKKKSSRRKRGGPNDIPAPAPAPGLAGQYMPLPQTGEANATNAGPDKPAPQESNLPRTGRRKQADRRLSWSGWGPAQFPKTRKVAGWDWDDHLQAYIANAPRKFACSCGEEHDTPSGYQRCKCGKAWHSYVIGTGGSNREAAADKFLVREIQVRPDVIVASRKQAGEWETSPHESEGSFLGHTPDHKIPQYLEHLRGKVRGQNISMGELSDLQGLAEHGYVHPDDMELHEAAGTPEEDFHRGSNRDWDNDAFDPREFGASITLLDPRTGNYHRLIDPGELDDGEDPGHPTFRKPPKDWARRGDGAKWTKSPIGS
jgi:hypothetical protein